MITVGGIVEITFHLDTENKKDLLRLKTLLIHEDLLNCINFMYNLIYKIAQEEKMNIIIQSICDEKEWDYLKLLEIFDKKLKELGLSELIKTK